MKWLEKALKQNGDYSAIEKTTRVYGGSINTCYYVRTEQNEYFIKHHDDAPKNFFRIEKDGLTYIKQAKAIAVPEVYSFSDQPNEAYLLLEWIEGQANEQTEYMLGEKLAQLHKTSGDYHGFPTDSYIGLLPQPNGLYDCWLTYYRDQKLLSQINLGIKKGVINGKRRERLEKLLELLPKWIPEDVLPSYLHGDLWGGNWLVGQGSQPYVVDPSFFFGDRQMEIAFTELFGGFSQKFYDAYYTTFPLDHTYSDVKPLYQLYYLIVHLNIFGKSYASQVDHVLDRYIGK